MPAKPGSRSLPGPGGGRVQHQLIDPENCLLDREPSEPAGGGAPPSRRCRSVRPYGLQPPSEAPDFALPSPLRPDPRP